MKKSGLRLLVILLALVVYGYVIPVMVSADNLSGEFEYTVLKDNTIEITKYKGNQSNLTIPDSLSKRPVTSIGEFAFMNCSSIINLTIPNSVTNIGQYAFGACSNLIDLYIPDSVISIGDGAFSCEKLESVTIGKGAKKFGGNPFSGCSSLTKIILADDHPNLELIDGVMFQKTEKSLILYPEALSFGSYSIPEGTISIAGAAFCANKSLIDLTIPDSVLSIGQEAFTGCKGLASLVIPDSVTYIGGYAFAGCTSLTKVVLPDTISSFGDGAFIMCSGLTTINIPGSVSNIGNMAFSRCTNLESVIIPNSVTSISENAFQNCSKLASLTIPNNVISIGNEAFSGCVMLTLAVGRDSYAYEYAVLNNVPYDFVKAQEIQIVMNGEYVNDKSLVIDLLSDNSASITLQATAWPENALQEFSWESSTPSVATVDSNGLVSIYAKGKTTIIAVATDGSNQKALCVLNVLNLAKEIVISGDSAVMAGMKTTLSALVLPEMADIRKVQWSTSNDSIATVSNSGVVTVKKIVEASDVVITATAMDGSNIFASHKITVYPPVSRVEIKTSDKIIDKESNTVIDLAGNSKTLQLQVNIFPASSYQSIVWKSSDPKIASVNESGLVTGHKKGAATITANAADGSKVKASVKVNVTYLAKEITITLSGELKAGAKASLKATVLPVETVNKKVKWSISDPEVATVSANGLVTIKKGTETQTATITATAMDGSGVFAEFLVTVSP